MYLLERVIIVWRGIFYLSVPMPYVSDWIFFSNNDSFLLKAQKFFWWKQILIIIFIHMSWQQSIIQICWFSAAWIVFAALKVSKPYKIAPMRFGVKTIPHICPLIKVIYTKYSKHCPYTVAHTIECVCSKINHGLNHGLFISLLKLILCPMHWIAYM